MKLSIIVPVYNAERWLRRCVKSLLNQDIDKSEYEILLVDDGSTDGSLVLAHQLAAEAGNVRVFTQPNAGPGAARNRGIDNAKGQYLMFVDADDYIKPKSLSSILDLAISNDIDLCLYRIIIVTKDNDTQQQNSSPLISAPTLLSEENLIRYPFGSACKCLFRKNMIDEHNIRFAPITYDEDTLFMTTVIAFSEKVVDTGSYIYIYDLTKSPSSRKEIIQRTKKRLLDSLVLIEETKKLSLSNQPRSKFKLFLGQRANSLIVSQVISIIRKRNVYGYDFVYKYIQAIRQKGLYPIKGKAISWKSTIVIPFVNFAICILLIYCRNKRQ